VPPELQFTPRRRAWLASFVEALRVQRGGAVDDELRMLTAIAWCGGEVPIEELARKACVSHPNAKVDSARKQARRVIDRLLVRGVIAVHTVRLPESACSHTQLRGAEGRAACVRQRAARQRGETCAAHHGYVVRVLAPGLTRTELAARLAIPDEEITRRVIERRQDREAERLETGKQGNDAEGRKLLGLPVSRGPKGTNHTSPRRRARTTERPTLFVPPHPPEGEGALKLERLLSGAGGDREDRLPRAPKALADCFAPPARVDVPGFVEPPPPFPLAGSGRADERGVQGPCHDRTPARPASERPKREREAARPVHEGPSGPLDLAGGGGPSPAKIAQIASARETRALVDWFRGAWASRKLPPMKRIESANVLWSRAKRFSRGELTVLLRVASRRAPLDGYATFRRIFADWRVASRLIDEERERPEGSSARGRSDLTRLTARRSEVAPKRPPSSPEGRAAELAKFAKFAGFADIHDVAESEES
jgi:hypothetical protein